MMIHIAFTIDSGFVRFCAVTMVSVLKNNASKHIKFHIVDDFSLSDADREALLRIASEYHAEIVFYHVPDGLIRDFELKWETDRLSKVVFYRCILSAILPASLSRVLYLDCDVLVLGDLSELWSVDMENCALAAMPDAVIVDSRRCVRLHYDASYNYFNGGVLLLNLDYWREFDIEKQCRRYYQTHVRDIVYNDQDLLNGLLFDKKMLLGMEWNLQESAFRRRMAHLYPRDLLAHAKILHFSSRKPWQYHCMHPLRYLFFEYQNLTEWKGETPCKSWVMRLRRFVHLLPYTLRIKEQKYVELNRIIQR